MKINKKAFTLVELLVVVLIIGILAAIAVPQYQKAIAKSRLASLKFIINGILNAQEAYYLVHDQYTGNFDTLDITMPPGERTTSYDSVGNVSVDKIIYDWGSCQISNSHVLCKNTKIKMNLDYYYSKAKSTPDLRVCTVEGTTDLTDYRNQICQQETGAESGTISNTYNCIFWYYE